MPLLVPLFFLAAITYGAAGFGGGSTYTALLALWHTDPLQVPVLSLACNILVVSAGCWRFGRAGHVDLARIWPLFAASVPMAFIGGALPVPRLVFTGLLAISLVIAGLLMLLQPRLTLAGADAPRPRSRWLEPVLGGALGLLSGIVGIGGGIYLAPALHLLRWGPAHAIAGTSAVFILVNSAAGLGGQLLKSGDAVFDILHLHWQLFPAVLIGGLIGSATTTRLLPARSLQVLTALLILFVACQLTIRFFVGLQA